GSRSERMRMKFFKLFCSVVCLMGICVSALAAGVLIVSNHDTASGQKGSTTVKAYIDKDRMRVETGDKEVEQIFIFRQDKERFWLINTKDQTYIEMTKQHLQKIKEQVDGAMAMIQEKMKNLPPEQRKMVEQMMQGKMPAAKLEAPKMVYKKVASGEKINQWICDKYEGIAKENDREEVWTTDWRQAGITAEDLKVMQGMGEFFAEFTKNQPFLLHIGAKDWEK